MNITCPPPSSTHRHAASPVSSPSRWARQQLFAKLNELQDGTLTINDATGLVVLGQGGSLRATIQVHDPAFYRHAVLGGSLSVAEAYLRGEWDSDDLVTFFRLFVRNLETTDRVDRWPSRVMNRLYHAVHANTRKGSRQNIHAHYDLGNEFFQLMLDDTMTYSSGIYLGRDSSLREAQVEKIDRLCRSLQLQASDHLLEIGTGWGSLAVHAATKYGCRVTTTTISKQQFDLAKTRITEAGVDDRVTLLQQDYRDLTGKFDKLVSVEMIEAVGHRFLDRYFAKCSELLRPQGSFALQAIVMPDHRYAQYLRSVDFIQKYVFPGGSLPSMSAIQRSTARGTDLCLVHAEDFAPHYARTLRDWRDRFHKRLDNVRGLGYPERFIRLWHYYLCYCEAAFTERYTRVMQIRFDKPRSGRSADQPDLSRQG